MMPVASDQPPLFSLMACLSTETRQKLGERRRELKARDGVEERLVKTEEGNWKLEYWQRKEKIEEISLA